MSSPLSEPSWSEHPVQMKKYKDAEREAAAQKQRAKDAGWIANLRSSTSSRVAAGWRDLNLKEHHNGGDAGHQQAVTNNLNAAEKQLRAAGQNIKDQLAAKAKAKKKAEE